MGLTHGQASLTRLVAALTISAALGPETAVAPGPDLYLPELVAEPDWFLEELGAAGAIIRSETRRVPS